MQPWCSAVASFFHRRAFCRRLPEPLASEGMENMGHPLVAGSEGALTIGFVYETLVCELERAFLSPGTARAQRAYSQEALCRSEGR